jgi:hypothetical protein
MLKVVTPETSDDPSRMSAKPPLQEFSTVYATASAYVKDRVLQVTLDGIDAPDRKGH